MYKLFLSVVQNTKSPTLKLPTTDAIPEFRRLPILTEPCASDDITCVQHGDVAYVSFDFYNGAMDTEQGKRLMETLQTIDKDPRIKMVALLGGDRFFSTGMFTSPFVLSFFCWCFF